jgi:CheY-like chemotaxis protein
MSFLVPSQNQIDQFRITVFRSAALQGNLQELAIDQRRDEFTGAQVPRDAERWRMEEKATVYVIVPDDAVRDSIQTLIETADLAAHSHASAASFLRIVPFPTNGCVLINHNLPDMTGLEVVEHLRRRGVALPVIVMTPGADPAMGSAAERFGALLLEKPFVPRRLIGLIQMALSR